MPIFVEHGDITIRTDDAIVNAANEALKPGGGVCGAIHEVAGPQLAQECQETGGCPTGSAIMTLGYGLPCKFVIHAVGPKWYGGDKGEAKSLADCYDAVFKLLIEAKLKSVALPAISTGIYGYPKQAAAEIAVDRARAFLEEHPDVDVTFVCLDEETAAIYEGLV